MQARYYDPVIGRFYSNDPVGFTGETDTFNRYSYVGNNPFKYVDPDGEAKVFIWLKGPTQAKRTSPAQMNKSYFGHAAVHSGTTYLSKFPGKDGAASTFHSFQDDFDTYGRPPDIILDLWLPDEVGAENKAIDIINNSEEWTSGNNCVDAVTSVLEAGGSEPFNFGSISLPTELDEAVKVDAKQLRRAPPKLGTRIRRKN